MSENAPLGSLYGVVFECPVPAELAAFYRAVLGGVLDPDDDEWVDLILPGGGLRLGFQRVPAYVPPEWPGDSGAQQAHLDIAVGDLDAAEQSLIALGARLMDTQATFRVYVDPVGHPFCTVH
ncbi:VOC family protein [Leucobacter luti]|uniref:Glyoxalase-like domain-containing protein n=1 Tax=Leucobacter luti TaxID=340320 RepID=A0A4Q7TJB0_9MICO|nr:VOC family protein [Leucobacter luti]MBL3700363.1 VOC family protein [Leucobacter luti]RZT60533.1 hypothetical protein EV139_2978 [Leucobacter luti]